MLPASDDAAKRLADLLTAHGIHATFKVVGEKARTLERRGRKDVIAALKRHTIAFHSNFHSVHPAPTEYLAQCGLLDGIAEFIRREGPGAADVRRIFGVKSLACYGQPGSSWAAQAVAGLKQIGVAPEGVPCYVDEGTHIGLEQKPFWYAGALNVYHMGANYTRMDLHDPSAVEPAKKKVSGIAERLAKEGGGLISIFYHPCEWVHREFWDGVNFAHGQNPPREEWKAPAQRTAEETDSAFERFAQYVDHIRGIAGVRFITAADLPRIYKDAVHSQGATAMELSRLANNLANSKEVNFQTMENKSFSLADQFDLFTKACAAQIRGSKLKFPLASRTLLGPDHQTAPQTNSQSTSSISGHAFETAVLDVESFLETQQRIPAEVFIGADPIAPADFLKMLATAWLQLAPGSDGNSASAQPLTVRVKEVALPQNTLVGAVKYVAEDKPNLFGGWIIHKDGFRAPKVLEIARLQTWTLKPALRAE